MRLKGITIFKLIYSNEIFISSNKNHYYFQPFNEVKNGIPHMNLVSSYFRYLNNMRPIVLLHTCSTIESLVVSCSVNPLYTE